MANSILSKVRSLKSRSASKRHRKSGITSSPAEVLEQRRLMTGEFEQVAKFDAYWVSIRDRVISHRFAPNETYKIEVKMSDGPLASNPEPPLGRLAILENGNVVKELEDYGKLDETYHGRFSSNGGRLSFRWKLFDGVHTNDPDLKLTVRVYARKKVNLRVGSIGISDRGDVHFSATIDGKSGARLDKEAEVQLFYAKGPDKSDILAAIDGPKKLGTKPGGWKKFTVAQATLLRNARPAGATHLIAVADFQNKASEINENWSDNSSAMRLPNIRIDSLNLRRFQDTEHHEMVLTYTVQNGGRHIGIKPDIELWFLNARGERVGLRAKPNVDMTQNKQSSFTIHHRLLWEVPEGAVSVGAIVDPERELLEADRADNFVEQELPGRLINTRLRVTGMRWVKSGPNLEGVSIDYRLQKGRMPLDLNPVLKFYWSNSQTVPVGAVAAHEKQLGWNIDQLTGRLEVSPALLGRKWKGEAFLIATIEMPEQIPREEYRARMRSLDATAVNGIVSPNLDGGGFAPARIKVASWLHQNRSDIKKAAKRFRIPEEALAGAIAYHATDVRSHSSGLVNQFSYDAMAVEGETKYRRGFVPVRSEKLRVEPLGATETVEYIAGIMRGYVFEARQNGFRIKEDADLLVSLFSNRLRRGSRDVPESLYTGISPSFLPKGGIYEKVDVPLDLGTPLFTEFIEAAGDSVEVYSWGSRSFDRNKQTFVLTHGFQSSASAWPVGVARALRQRYPDSNILLVDWSNIAVASPFSYSTVAGLVNDVGYEVGARLALDPNIQIQPSRLHFIGHSLGAHVSGAAASAVEKLKGTKVQQVTGLDPAGPEFNTIDGKVDERFRLDPEDAERVVALHTSRFFFGFADRLAHLDLFVNWDIPENQPGQSVTTGIIGNHGYATELMRLLIGGHRFRQTSHYELGSHLDWSDVESSSTTGAIRVGTINIPDFGFGLFISPQHLLVRGAVDTTVEYKFRGNSTELQLPVSKVQVISKGNSVVSLLTLERPIAGVHPNRVTGRYLQRQFPNIERPGRLAQDIQRTIGIEVARSGHINLGTASYYFKRLNENDRQPRPNKQIARWVRANSAFIDDAMEIGTSSTRSLLRGDANSNLEYDTQDTDAMRSLILSSAGMNATELRNALFAADLNDDGVLNERDFEYLQQLVAEEQAPFEAADDHITIVGGATEPIEVLDNDIALNKRSLQIIWVDQPNHGEAEIVAGKVKYTPKPDFIGEESFRYVIESESGGLSEAWIHVTVLPVAHVGTDLKISGSMADDHVEITEADGHLLINMNGQTASIVTDKVTTIHFEGGEGNDRFVNRTSLPSIAHGGPGNDEFRGGVGVDQFFGDIGDDLLFGGAGRDRLYGNDGDDRLFGERGADFLSGGSGTDTLNGQCGHDELFGNDGIDHLFGGLGNDALHGGFGNDKVEGGDGDDRVHGGRGNDLLSGNAGNDVLAGDTGNDTLFGHEGTDTLFGGDGNDVLKGGRGSDRIDGGAGNDRLQGGKGRDTLVGEAGNDTLGGGDGNDRLEGGDGNDVLYGNAGNDVLLGQGGNDSLFGESGDDILRGDAGDDFLRGDEGNDRLHGGLGNDRLQGRGGNDRLHGDAGNDTLEGQRGNDHLEGGDGNDVLYGNSGHDAMHGQNGNDSMFGEAGNDRMYGGHGNDFLRGDDGNDHLDGGHGNDHLKGEAGDDYLQGNAGNDFVEGGAGNDNVRGGSGVDSLYGNGGNDILSGGDHTDYLYGGRGDDSLYGDAGRDYLDGQSGNDRLDGRWDGWWSRRIRRFRGWIWR